MIITRRDILKAIRTEPLKAGYWIEKEGTKDCTVCAIGAVLRSKKKRYIYETAALIVRYSDFEYSGLTKKDTKDGTDIKKAKNGNDFMALLSNEFELLSKKYITKKAVKNNLIKFVKKHFPVKMKVVV